MNKKRGTLPFPEIARKRFKEIWDVISYLQSKMKGSLDCYNKETEQAAYDALVYYYEGWDQTNEDEIERLLYVMISILINRMQKGHPFLAKKYGEENDAKHEQ